MNEIELLKYQIKSLEKSLLEICKDLNTRMNKIENEVYELRQELDYNKKGCDYSSDVK